MPSASAIIAIEVNSLTDCQLGKYCEIFQKSKEELASLILAWGFSNLPKVANSDSDRLSFLSQGFSNPPHPAKPSHSPLSTSNPREDRP